MVRSKEETENLVRSSGHSRSSLSYGSIKSESITPPAYGFLCTRRDTIIVLVALLLASIVIITTLVIGLPKIKEKEIQYYDTTFHPSPSPLRSYSNAVVLTDGKPCAAIGKSILEKNGSAVDAAIAGLFCNGVVTPQSMGLGGGFFMVIYSKSSGLSEVIDARETAPAAATAEMFGGNKTLSETGGLSVAIPGELKGYWDAWTKHGKLEWKDLIEPSIAICENGFEVSEHLEEKLKSAEQLILSMPSMKEEFVNNATGEIFKQGEVLKRPVLAATLRVIATEGAKALYNGSLSKQFVEDIRDCGGIITEQDLKDYSTKSKEALKVDLGSTPPMTLHTVPPPGSGAIGALILNILKGYNWTRSAMDDLETSVLNYHRMIESFKFSFAQREYLADEDFSDMSDLVTKLVSKEFADETRTKISDDQTFDPQYYEAPSKNSEDHGTSQVSVLAANGDAVSVTSTINTYFGSKCRSPSTGIILNNDMDDFSSPNITNFFDVPPFPSNYIAPGKRPLSSMMPSIVVDDEGQVIYVLGGMGGTHIITATAQAMMRLIWLNADAKEATDAPRLHHQLYPNYAYYEEGFPKVYVDKLKKYGHDMRQDTKGSVILIIARKEDKIEANVDYRKGGSVDGF